MINDIFYMTFLTVEIGVSKWGLNLGFEIDPNWLKSNLELRFVDGATMLLLVKKDK